MIRRVVVAMSGGVDSSVAALLLQEAGYQVVGVTLRLWTVDRPEAPRLNRGCCSVEDIDDARRVCQLIEAPHYVINAEQEFAAFVVDYFTREYQRGRTPHPCIACNDRIKFDFLLQRALALEADFIATGHYARVASDEEGKAHLLKAVTPQKDQSYVLFGLTQPQLQRILLPVGDYTKGEIREIARRRELPVADKPDSQEICFIPNGDYRSFLAGRIKPTPGPIVDVEGNVLGHHQGIEFYTVGQRRGLGIAADRPLYVVALETEGGRVVVGPREALEQPVLWASQVNWISGMPPETPLEVSVKIRYKAEEVAALLVPHDTSVEIRFREPQRAVTPGQAVVFYEGDELLGGGFIDGPRSDSTAIAGCKTQPAKA
ncbi:MAG: tRNA 2-thiouridine(34) synthase MnmA [Chloroflexi bacterium]|nr:tRNA 2-thiouridine(34) synthase MnmA [Chloroflexota bacterium]